MKIYDSELEIQTIPFEEKKKKKYLKKPEESPFDPKEIV